MTDTTQDNLVKRLDLQYGGQDVWMGEDPDGDYVSFEDYAALEAKLAAERERIADLERRLKLWVPQNISETGRWPIREGGE